MPTPESPPFLDRAEGLRLAEPIVERVSPLLGELLNRGAQVFVQAVSSEQSRLGKENEDVAAISLYRGLLEALDGIEVSFSASSVRGAIPLLRSLFERSLALDYLLSDPALYSRRSLSWFHHMALNEIGRFERYVPTGPISQEYAAIYEKELGEQPSIDAFRGYSARRVAGIRGIIDTAQFAEIRTEHVATRKRLGKKYVEWFSLFDGPTNRRALASALGREAEYLTVYGPWSAISHGTDITPMTLEGEVTAFAPLRTPENMQTLALMVSFFAARSTRNFSKHFVPAEDVEAWLLRDVVPLQNALEMLEITFD